MPFVCERAGSIHHRWCVRIGSAGRFVLSGLPSEVLFEDRTYWVPDSLYVQDRALWHRVRYMCSVPRGATFASFLSFLSHFFRSFRWRSQRSSRWRDICCALLPYLSVVCVHERYHACRSSHCPSFCVELIVQFRWHSVLALDLSAARCRISRFCFFPGCYIFTPRLRLCRGCRSVRYCSVSHQKRHWIMSHRFQCVRSFS